MKNDPFAPENRRHFNIAGTAVALGSATLVAIVALTGGGSGARKKPQAHQTPPVPQHVATQSQGQQLATSLERGQSPDRMRGIVAIYNKGKLPTVVVNPYVEPAGPTPPHAFAQSETRKADYNYYAVVADKDPATGKITFTPNEVLHGGVSTHDAGASVAIVPAAHGDLLQQGPVSTVRSTSLGDPDHYSFTGGAESTFVSRLGHYTYSLVGSIAVVPANQPVAVPDQNAAGLLLQANPIG